MVKQLLQGVQAAIALVVLDRYRCLSAELIKIEATRAYVHGVQVARCAALGLVQIRLILALIVLGVLLAHAGLFVLLPWTLQHKAILGLALGLSYVIIGCVALCAAMKENAWLEKSGVTRLLNEINKTRG